jgi:hypothetical protein
LREDDKDPSCLRYRSKADPEKTQSTQAEGVREYDKKPEKTIKNQKKTRQKTRNKPEKNYKKEKNPI